MDNVSDSDSEWSPKTFAKQVKKRTVNAARARKNLPHNKIHSKACIEINDEINDVDVSDSEDEWNPQRLHNMFKSHKFNKFQKQQLQNESDSDDEWNPEIINKINKNRTRNTARSRKLQHETQTTKFSWFLKTSLNFYKYNISITYTKNNLTQI